MSGIRNPQIADGAVSAEKTDASVTVSDGSHPLTGDLPAGGHKITGLAPGVATTDAVNFSQLTAAAGGFVPHQSVRALTTSNHVLIGPAAIDGVTVPDGSRVLLVGQTAPVENGAWVTAAGAWSRPADFAPGDSAQGAMFYVEAGDLHGGSQWACFTLSPNDVVDADPLTFAIVMSEDRARGQLLNVVALVTTVDGDQATASVFTSDNTPGNALLGFVDGLQVPIGNGSKVGVVLYVSGDGGATARLWSAVVVGDTIHYNGSEMGGAQLAATDTVSIYYLSNA